MRKRQNLPRSLYVGGEPPFCPLGLTPPRGGVNPPRGCGALFPQGARLLTHPIFDQRVFIPARPCGDRSTKSSHHDRVHEGFSESWMIGDFEFVGVEKFNLGFFLFFDPVLAEIHGFKSL